MYFFPTIGEKCLVWNRYKSSFLKMFVLVICATKSNFWSSFALAQIVIDLEAGHENTSWCCHIWKNFLFQILIFTFYHVLFVLIHFQWNLKSFSSMRLNPFCKLKVSVWLQWLSVSFMYNCKLKSLVKKHLHILLSCKAKEWNILERKST